MFDLDIPGQSGPAHRHCTGFAIGGRRQIFLVACAAYVPENRLMVKLFFKETKIKDLDLLYILLGDEKMKNLIFGKFHIWMKCLKCM